MAGSRTIGVCFSCRGAWVGVVDVGTTMCPFCKSTKVLSTTSLAEVKPRVSPEAFDALVLNVSREPALKASAGNAGVIAAHRFRQQSAGGWRP